MKYFVLSFLLIVFSATIFAQNPSSTPAASPTPLGETPEDWQRFTPSEEGFTLDAPGKITPGFINTRPDNAIKSRNYATIVGGNYYFIFSDLLDKPFQNRMVSTFADSQAPGIKPNEIYSFTDNFGYFHKILILKDDQRIYTFQTVSPNKNDISTKRFFEGIRVKNNQNRPAEKTAVQNLLSIPVAENTPVSIYCPEDSATPASSAENASLSADAVKNTNSSPSNATEGINVISKPRAQYTDFARFYQIQGQTQLRVTFLANGKIGTVSVTKKMPFGLIEQSLQAACGLTFKPATKNGIPYTVIKQVFYNFTLY